MLVIAGPGTGKTRILTHWIARGIRRGAVKPEEVLAVTFTNRAAREMRERLETLLGDDGEQMPLFRDAAKPGGMAAPRVSARGALVTTFHSLCFSILREHDPSLETIYSSANREDLLRVLLARDKGHDARGLARRIQRHYEGMEEPDGELLSVLGRYEDWLSRTGAVDLSALVEDAARLLRENPALLESLRARYRCIAVDELQDINAAQYGLLRLIGEQESDGNGRSLLCIGDPDQAIYGFRGSDRALFFKLRDGFSARVFTLRRAYRSTETIVRAAEAVLAGDARAEPRFTVMRPPGGLLGIFPASDPAEEGYFISETIRRLVGGVDSVSADLARDETAGYSFKDIAVLFRTRAVRDALLPSLLRSGIPVTLGDEQPIHAREPFVFLIAALRLLINPKDAASLTRLLGHIEPDRPSGAAAAVILEAAVEPMEIPAYLAARAMISVASRGRLENVLSRREPLLAALASGIGPVIDLILSDTVRLEKSNEVEIGMELIRDSAEEFGPDLAGFLRRLSLLAVESEGVFRTEKVKLLTFHAAKGLEFPVVFLAGVEEGIVPLPEDLDEERRLFYVAMTRAGDSLYISHCARRSVHGLWKEMQASRFLKDIPARCRRAIGPFKRKRPNHDTQLPLFP